MSREKVENPLKLDIYDCDGTLTKERIYDDTEISNILKTDVPLKHDDNNILAIATLNPYLEGVKEAVERQLKNAKNPKIEWTGKIEELKTIKFKIDMENGITIYFNIVWYTIPGKQYPLLIAYPVAEVDYNLALVKKVMVSEIANQLKNLPITQFSFTDDVQQFLDAVKNDKESGRKFTTIKVDPSAKTFTPTATTTPCVEKSEVTEEKPEVIEEQFQVAEVIEEKAEITEKKPENLCKLSEQDQKRLNQLESIIAKYGEIRHADKREYKVPLLPFFHRFGFQGLAGCSRTHKLWAVGILLKEIEKIKSGGMVSDLLILGEACTFLMQGTQCRDMISKWEQESECSMQEFVLKAPK